MTRAFVLVPETRNCVRPDCNAQLGFRFAFPLLRESDAIALNSAETADAFSGSTAAHLADEDEFKSSKRPMPRMATAL